jgi:hypothetical protein
MTEAQITEALRLVSGADIAIAVMHHPLHWLEEVEQAKAEQMIGRDCHIVLHGHEHRPNMSRVSNAFGDTVTIPAGACYNRRIPSDPRYSNAYNFCSVDLESNVGTIFHRVWQEENDEWRPDERFWSKGRSLFFIQKKQPFEQQKIARRALNHLSKNYLQSIYKRSAISQEIVLKHEPFPIDGEPFVKAHVRITLTFHSGVAEFFKIESQVNQRIVSHPNPAVSSAAYKLLNPEAGQPQWTPDSARGEGIFRLGQGEEVIRYEYEMLEMTDGVYLFNLRRFTDNVKFTLIKDPTLNYEDLAFGGFPAKQSIPDDMLNADIWVTTELAMPNQGVLVQWYPKPKTVKTDPPNDRN